MRFSSSTILLLLCGCFANLPFAEAAPWTKENAAWNVNRNPDGKDPSTYYGEWANHTYFPSSDDWRREGVYHLVTDRFDDGDPTNNERAFGGYDLTRVDTRHGGDFRGIERRLDYIKGLGYSAIWISPIFQAGFNEYHGYGARDFTLIDQRFGTLEDLRSLVTAAHSRGMYIFVDVVVNHLANLYYFEDHQNDTAPFRLHRGEYRLLSRDPQSTYADFSVDNTFIPEGVYPPMYNKRGLPEEDHYGQGSFWRSDFHHNGNLSNFDDPWQIYFGKIYGVYDDLRIEETRVQEKVIAMTKALISSTDIDGIRIDTPMQVPLSFFKHWTPAVKAHAAQLGKKDFFMFGETLCVAPRTSVMIGRGKTPPQYGTEQTIDRDVAMDGGINYLFYQSFVMRALAKEQPDAVFNLPNAYRQDRRNLDLWDASHGETRYRMLNFSGSHDQRRLSTYAHGREKLDLAAQAVSLWPGVPILYYGDEQGLSSLGRGLEGHAREDMVTSLAWLEQPAVEEPNRATFDNFDMTNSHYLVIARIMNLRRLYPALVHGDVVTDLLLDRQAAPGVYAYRRDGSSDDAPVLVLMNASAQSVELQGEKSGIHSGWAAGGALNPLDSSQRFTLDSAGTLSGVSMAPWSIKTLVRTQDQRELDPLVLEVSPRHDALLTKGDQKVTLRFDRAMDVDAVVSALRYDEAEVSPSSITVSSDHQQFSFDVSITEGLHFIGVSSRARSAAGRGLYAPFRSRFRVGGPENAQERTMPSYDPLLINNGQQRILLDDHVAQVTLGHHLPGAVFFRASENRGWHWSEWLPYTPTSPWTLYGGGWKSMLVQYWIDGSAAYFVRGGIDLVEPQDWDKGREYVPELGAQRP